MEQENQIPFPQQVSTFYYVIKHEKEVEDIDGNKVTIFDDSRTERVSKEHLESEKVQLQKEIEEIDKKLTLINEIK